MDPVQIRMARAALSWDIPTLAGKSGLAPETVTKLETGCRGEPVAEMETETAALRYAFEQAGLMIVPAEKGTLKAINTNSRMPIRRVLPARE